MSGPSTILELKLEPTDPFKKKPKVSAKAYPLPPDVRALIVDTPWLFMGENIDKPVSYLNAVYISTVQPGESALPPRPTSDAVKSLLEKFADLRKRWEDFDAWSMWPGPTQSSEDFFDEVRFVVNTLKADLPKKAPAPGNLAGIYNKVRDVLEVHGWKFSKTYTSMVQGNPVHEFELQRWLMRLIQLPDHFFAELYDAGKFHSSKTILGATTLGELTAFVSIPHSAKESVVEVELEPTDPFRKKVDPKKLIGPYVDAGWASVWSGLYDEVSGDKPVSISVPAKLKFSGFEKVYDLAQGSGMYLSTMTTVSGWRLDVSPGPSMSLPLFWQRLARVLGLLRSLADEAGVDPLGKSHAEAPSAEPDLHMHEGGLTEWDFGAGFKVLGRVTGDNGVDVWAPDSGALDNEWLYVKRVFAWLRSHYPGYIIVHALPHEEETTGVDLVQAGLINAWTGEGEALPVDVAKAFSGPKKTGGSPPSVAKGGPLPKVLYDITVKTFYLDVGNVGVNVSEDNPVLLTPELVSPDLASVVPDLRSKLAASDVGSWKFDEGSKKFWLWPAPNDSVEEFAEALSKLVGRINYKYPQGSSHHAPEAGPGKLGEVTVDWLLENIALNSDDAVFDLRAAQGSVAPGGGAAAAEVTVGDVWGMLSGDTQVVLRHVGAMYKPS